MNGFIRYCGIALVFGAVLLILINVGLTPAYMAIFEEGEAVARASDIYLYRISAALVDALLLLFGCIGLYLGQKADSGKLGTIAFLLTFVGTSFLVAIEWANLFVMRPLAQTSPEALVTLDESALLTAGFVIGLSFFMLGWLLNAISSLLAKVLPRWAAWSTLAGLILIPALGASPLGVAGQVIGNAVFGLGLAGLGYAVVKRDDNVISL